MAQSSKRRASIALALLLAWGWPLAAQSPAPAPAPRVAYVDMQRVINESELFRVGRQRLTEEFAARSEALNLEEARLRELERQRDREASTLPAADLAELRTRIDTLERSLQRRRISMNQALNQRSNELLQDIDQRIREEIAAYARSEGLDLVLIEGVGFAHPRLDVTDVVLRRINAADGSRP